MLGALLSRPLPNPWLAGKLYIPGAQPVIF